MARSSPVSSNSSRRAAAWKLSPGSSAPPGVAQKLKPARGTMRCGQAVVKEVDGLDYEPGIKLGEY